MIEIANATKQYRGAAVLKGFTLTISEPGIYCLLGRNGAGKTTLLKSIAGYQNLSGGSILVNEQPISTATMNTGVSYIENFARHFNLPVKRLIRLAGDLNPLFDAAFAAEMMDRFELEGCKKFNRLSLGMKTMVSTLLCLASNQPVVLLDEPVLGFDAIMRTEFYALLAESYARSPRIILVSTHIIDEITKVMQRLIVIDKGALRFYDTLAAIEQKAWQVSGTKQAVEQATEGLYSVGQTQTGGLLTRYLFDEPIAPALGLEVDKLSLQDFFIHMVEKKGGLSS